MEDDIKKGLITVLKPYKNNEEFIAKIIVLNCSGILLGCKPACTITFGSRNSKKDTLHLWNMHKNMIFKSTRLKYMELYEGIGHTLVLLYDECKLKLLFENHEFRLFFNSLGYNTESTVEEMLCELKNRFKYSFPHEIGAFVGLPLKDVMGFMNMNSLKLSCKKGWNIYGDAEPSLNIWKQYEICRNTIIKMLMNNTDPFEILREYPNDYHDLFWHGYVSQEVFTATRGTRG